MGFFLILLVWTVIWLAWNVLAPKELQFDPPMELALWFFISNLIQILLIPLILAGQNLQSRHAEARAEYELGISKRAEKEVDTILQQLEQQNIVLAALLERQGIKLEERRGKTKKP
jgi:uncharacterized membrane protein